MPVKRSNPAQVASLKHNDTRKNIPTKKLRDFVAEDEAAPRRMLYPRDPSLDPQLVWKGKDEQDAEALTVPLVPVYIQEKIHPQALIDDLLAQAARPGDGVAEEAATCLLNLFADFNGLPEEFDQRVDFYQCYGPVYLDSRRPDCSEPWAFISPLFIPDENARIAAKLFGSRQRTSKALPAAHPERKKIPRLVNSKSVLPKRGLQGYNRVAADNIPDQAKEVSHGLVLSLFQTQV